MEGSIDIEETCKHCSSFNISKFFFPLTLIKILITSVSEKDKFTIACLSDFMQRYGETFI